MTISNSSLNSLVYWDTLYNHDHLRSVFVLEICDPLSRKSANHLESIGSDLSSLQLTRNSSKILYCTDFIVSGGGGDREVTPPPHFEPRKTKVNGK